MGANAETIVSPDPPVSFVEETRANRRWRSKIIAGLIGLIGLLGLVTLILIIVVLFRLTQDRSPYIPDIVAHFEHGSIGSEPESGLPYYFIKALPSLFPEAFDGQGWGKFGFLHDDQDDDLPIGFSRRLVDGVDVAWLNCAVCHTGTYRTEAEGERHIVPGMPSNNLDLYTFFTFILEAGADERLAYDSVIPAMQAQGADLGWFDKLMWRLVILPRVREGLIQRRSRVLPLLEVQSPWGPGRVDTFNPYKFLQFDMTMADLDESEIHGVAEFPSIFLQSPRDGMQLHWDGNNPSLAERNLSAALGAGVTPETVDHEAIERIALWLQDLQPPASPIEVDAEAAGRGLEVYMANCATCHGYQGPDGYVFEGERLGMVEPLAEIGTDPGRFDSYTERFANYQKQLFAGTEHQFQHFRKTDGYANHPLDGLWLRAPYLHNGSVAHLSDLLVAPDQRMPAFVRGDDLIDAENGGFVAPSCDPATYDGDLFCYDTSLPGNGNQGHQYGTDLPPEAKADLLAYLKTF